LNLLKDSKDTLDSFFQKYALSDIAKDETKKNIGISTDDILFLEDGIFIFLPKKELQFGIVYKKILQRREVEESGLPYLHLYLCDILKKDRDHLRNLYTFIRCERNGFDFVVKEGRVDVKVYYEKPLEVCPICVERYNKIHGCEKSATLFDISRDFILPPHPLPKDEAKAVGQYNKLYSDYCDECGVRGTVFKSFLYHKKAGGYFIKSLCKNCLKRGEDD